MVKIKNRNELKKLCDFLPLHIIQEFSNCTYEERKIKLKEAKDFLKHRHLEMSNKPAFEN